MTSAATLHCPHCMAEVPKRMVANVPGLILIDRYYCWNCGTMTIREELVWERHMKLLIGEPPPIRQPNTNFVLGPTAAFQDPFGFTTLSTPAFTPIANELVVACVAHVNGSAPVSVTCGGTQMTLAASEIDVNTPNGPDNYQLNGTIWYLPNAPQVSSQVSVTFDGQTSVAAVIIVQRFYELTSLSHSTSEVGVAPNYDTGLTPPQTSIGHLAVAMVATNRADGQPDPPIFFTNEALFTDGISVGAYSVPGSLEASCLMIFGFLFTDEQVRASGLTDVQPNNVAVLQVFKP